MRRLALFAAAIAALSLPARAQVYWGWSPDYFAAGSCSATCSTVSISTTGAATVSVQATGTGTGITFVFEGSNDKGATWQTLPGVVPSTGASITSASANGIWLVPVAGFWRMRINLTAIGGGTETFNLEATTRPAFAYAP